MTTVESFSVYSAHGASGVIAKAFSEGSGWKYTPVERYREGQVAMYGLARGLREALDKCQSDGHDWIFMDHGYLGPQHYSGYYSVTKNAYQHTGVGVETGGTAPIPELSPMRAGRRIVILPPSFVFAPFVGIDVNQWIVKTVDEVKKHTDRPIFIRYKMSAIPLEKDLKDAHAVVTYNSKAAIKALIMGIPAFATDKCCVWGCGSNDLSMIDNRQQEPDRIRWLRTLAANQFTLDEIRSGFCLEKVMK